MKWTIGGYIEKMENKWTSRRLVLDLCMSVMSASVFKSSQLHSKKERSAWKSVN